MARKRASENRSSPIMTRKKMCDPDDEYKRYLRALEQEEKADIFVCASQELELSRARLVALEVAEKSQEEFNSYQKYLEEEDEIDMFKRHKDINDALVARGEPEESREQTVSGFDSDIASQNDDQEVPVAQWEEDSDLPNVLSQAMFCDEEFNEAVWSKYCSNL